MKHIIKYILIYILNLVDYALTVYWTGLHGIEHEINPIMRWALSTPGVFTMVKLFLFPLLLLWMWWKKKDDTAYMALGMFIVVVMLNIRTVFGIF
jgi:hypothetical protein